MLIRNTRDQVIRGVILFVDSSFGESSRKSPSERQVQALLNEIKGNLFEYLLAKKLSLNLGELKQFLMDANTRKFSPLFTKYEAFLRRHDIHLLGKLEEFSDLTCKRMLSALKTSSLELARVRLVGKRQKSFADLELISNKGERVGIGLKLGKSGSYVNTKSGGVGSFISRYFASFPEAASKQKSLDEVISRGFYEMGQKLYDLEGLGHFDQFKRWRERELAELPGDLPPELSRPVLHFYQQIIRELHTAFSEFLALDPVQFFKQILALIGMPGHEYKDLDFWQIMLFYSLEEGRRYEYESLKFFSWRKLRETYSEVKKGDFGALGELKASSFEMKLKEGPFQIRIKPMNKFTVPSFKVNCSLRVSRFAGLSC